MAAGFVNFEIPGRADVFSGAPQAGSAANFGTLGINLRARKARRGGGWAAMNCGVPYLGYIAVSGTKSGREATLASHTTQVDA